MRAVEKLARPVTLKSHKFSKPTPCAIEIMKLFSCWRDNSVDGTECLETGKLVTACMAGNNKLVKDDLESGKENDVNELNAWVRKAWMKKRI